MARVSIVIPNYNHRPYLKRRIESVLNQTYRDFEVILLDDASTDDSVELLCKYESHPNVRCLRINESNSGSVFKQWNLGAELAQGTYLWIAESDDWCEPDFLETLVPLLDANHRLGVAYCQSRVVYAGHEREAALWKDLIPRPEDRGHWECAYEVDGPTESVAYLFDYCFIPNVSSALIRREAFLSVGRADCSYRVCGDYHFWAKLLAQWGIAYNSRPLNYWNRHGAGLSSTARVRMLCDTYRVLSWMRKQHRMRWNQCAARYRALAEGWLDYFAPDSRMDQLRIAMTAVRCDPQFLRHVLRYGLASWYWKSVLGKRWHRWSRPLRGLRRKHRIIN